MPTSRYTLTLSEAKRMLGGGLPVRVGGDIIGAVGASAGSVEQDIAVAEAAASAIGEISQELNS